MTDNRAAKVAYEAVDDAKHRPRRLPRLRPLGAFGYYLAIVLIFATAYALLGALRIPGGSDPVRFLDACYFSVVTITTLGYGDIVPADGTGRILAMLEVLLGVIVIGLFLNSLWQAYTDRIAEEQRAVAAEIADRERRRRLAVYLPQFEGVFGRFAASQRGLTGGTDEEGSALHTEFRFKDLRSMFGPARSTLASFSRTAVDDYFVNLERINRELRFILTQFDIHDDRDLHRDVVQMLQVSDAFDARAALESYPQMRVGEETLAQFAAKQIEAEDGDPPLDKYRGNALTPVVFFYHALRRQTELASRIHDELRQATKPEQLTIGPDASLAPNQRPTATGGPEER